MADLKLGLGEAAQRLNGVPGMPIPAGLSLELEATAYYAVGKTAYANGSNVAEVEVEVDIETGAVRLLRYSVGHDCGILLNPKLVDGQIIGGVVHGIGNALLERMVYDAGGQPLTMNYGEYLLPLATEMPPITVEHLQSPSPLNPLGVKGAGEGGTIPAAAAVIAAIEMRYCHSTPASPRTRSAPGDRRAARPRRAGRRGEFDERLKSGRRRAAACFDAYGAACLIGLQPRDCSRCIYSTL